MRKNEFNTLKDFISQYIEEWNPSEGHWLVLDFYYHNREYRFSTDSMYDQENTILPDGKEAIFYLYVKIASSDNYVLLGEFAIMEDVSKAK
ncbi:MAG: hypothetical protein ACK5LT_01020 [Lachnospirales bacterium]